MSKTVGFLKDHVGQGGGKGFIGTLDMSAAKGQIALKPNDEKRSASSPDFQVLFLAQGRSDGWRDFGIAWRKTPNGKPAYLSILLNDDSLPMDFNIAAFPPGEGDKDDRWRIVWGRQRGGNVRAEAAVADGDSIPF